MTTPPVPRIPSSFWTYLKSNVPNHLKLVSIIAGVIALVITYNWVSDMRKELDAQKQVTQTLSQRFQAIPTGAAVSGNSTASQTDVNRQASAAFDPATLALMQAQNAKIDSLTTAIGLVNYQVTSLTKPTAFAPSEQNAVTGALVNYPMEDARSVPLSRLNLSYDPTKRDAATAFSGTNWTHYQETFQSSFGEWVKQPDGGYATTVKMTRSVAKPDPNDPTKLVQVGQETIPISGSTTVYTPKGLLQGAPGVLPRWTLGVGLSKNTAGTYMAGHIDYRVTPRFGAWVGTANNGVEGGLSIRLDAKK